MAALTYFAWFVLCAGVGAWLAAGRTVRAKRS